jgi:flagellar motility protein MotE (MotC chaperone)
MQTIRLRVNDSIFQQLMWFLKRFDKNEIEVINENEEYLSIQEYLKKELENIENGTADFISFNQLDEELESTIRKYED